MFLISILLLTGCGNKEINISTKEFKIDQFNSFIYTNDGYIKEPFYFTNKNDEIIEDAIKWKVDANKNVFYSYFTLKNLSNDSINSEDIDINLIVNKTRKIKGNIFINNNQKDKNNKLVLRILNTSINKDEEKIISTLINIPDTLVNSNDELEIEFIIKNETYNFDIRKIINIKK